MKISIITVNYNSGDDLIKTLKSCIEILNTLPSELLVIDGCSNNFNSYDYSSLHNSIKVFSEKDNGIYDAMNKGISKSHGEWIWFVNSGDTVSIDKLLFKNILLNIKNENFIYGDFSVNNLIIKQNLSIFYLYRGMINHQSIIYSRNIIDTFDLTYGASSDYAHLLKNFKYIIPLKIDTSFVNYNLDGLSSNFSRLFRSIVWLQRSRAILNSTLPIYHIVLGSLFCFCTALIKFLLPRIFSKIYKINNVI